MENGPLCEYFNIFPGFEDLALRVIYCLHTPESTPRAHNHQFYELVLICEGTARHQMNDEAVELRPGNLLLVPPGKVHLYLNPNSLGIFNILFEDEILNLFREDLGHLPAFQLLFNLQPELRKDWRAKSGVLALDSDTFSTAATLARTLEKEMAHPGPGGRTLCLGLFLQLMTCCLRGAHLPDGSDRNYYVERIGRLLCAFDRHPEKEWALEQMAELVQMSEANFRLHFQRLTGRPPGKFLLDLRLKKAAGLLLTSPLRIGEIALRTGFRDTNYFSRQFHARYGRSPRAYRS